MKISQGILVTLILSSNASFASATSHLKIPSTKQAAELSPGIDALASWGVGNGKKAEDENKKDELESNVKTKGTLVLLPNF